MGATHMSGPLIVGGGVIGAGAQALGMFAAANAGGADNVFFVDGDGGGDGNDGLSPTTAKATIQAAIDLAVAGGVIYIKARKIAAGGTDPVSYAEVLTISAVKAGLALIGVSTGPKQAAQPQIKKGSGAVALLTIRAPGCLISGLTFNGAGSTGGGILLDDDGSTKTAMGTIIEDCFFKNCKGSGATSAATGGAVQIGSNGGCWNSLIRRCEFHKCVGGIVLLGTAQAVPQNLTIEDCTFTSTANTNVDCDVFLNAGSGLTNLIIRNCDFATVDVPNAGTENHYLDLTQVTNGLLAGCRFACTGKTFGAAGDAASIPATVRIASCHQEDAIITRT